ncbi:hypothetical protein Tco_0746205 [Tanacetum coccineum]
MLVVRSGSRVADEVETQVVFSVNHVSFSSFFMLQPNQLGAGQSDHGLLTSPMLRTAFCNLHKLCRSWIPTCSGEESLLCGGGRIVVVVVAVAIAVVVAGSGRCTLGESGLEMGHILGSLS